MSGLINGKSAMLENKDLRRYGPASFSEFKNIEVLNEDNQPISIFKIGEAMKVKFDIELKENISNLEIGFNLNNLTNTNLSTFIGEWEGLPTKFEAGKHSMTCKIEKLHCFPGNYAVSAWLKRKNDPVDQQIDQAVQFTVASDDITGFNPDFRYPNMGVYQKSKWHLEKN
jgi:hypothetical protein